MLRLGLATAEQPARARRYRLQPVGLGETRPGIDIAKALSLADRLEDEELRRELGARK